MNFCTSCGDSVRPGTGFCTTCGARLVPQAAAGGPAAEPRTIPVEQAGGLLGPAEHPADADAYTAYGVQPYPAGYPYDVDPYAPVPEPGPRRRTALIAGAVVAVLTAAAAGVGVTVLLGDDGPAAPGSVAAAGTGGAGAGGAGAGQAGASTDATGPSSTGAEPDPVPGDGPETAPPAAPSSAATLPPPPSRRLQPVSVTADCFAPPAKDSAGRTVTYEPERVADGVPETAWRCTGAAVGNRLVLRFAAPVTVTSVGLVPGYDKIDPLDGIDRFTENRTVTAVDWSFDEGSAWRQDIPVPTRDLARLALDAPVTTTTVTLQVADTGNDGARRDYTPVSEVEVLGH